MLRYFKNIVSGIGTMMEGLGIVLTHAFRRRITLEYPEKKRALPLRFRGRLVLPTDPETGANRCTACMLCVKACPNHSLDVERMTEEGKPKPKPAKYLYNLGSCMFCNLCVEACPFSAIIMSDEYELGLEDRSRLSFDLAAEKYELAGAKRSLWLSKFKSAASSGIPERHNRESGK